MSNENGGGRIHLLGHQGKRPPKAQVEQEMADHIATIARAATVPVVEFYMQQVPGLVAHMLAEAFEAHGLVLQPPTDGAPAPTSADAADDAAGAVQGTGETAGPPVTPRVSP